mgnify:CR=1 FL=1
MNPPPLDPEEAKARGRYMALNLARLGGIAVTLVGLAGVRLVLPLPYLLSVALVLAGIGAFFFGPPMMGKRWIAQDGQDGG